MNLFFRQSIIVLLLVLQGLSPLVHAHVQEDTGEYGLHVDGFQILTENNPQISAFDSIAHEDVVIGMRSAIQQKNLLNNMQNTGLDCSGSHYRQADFVEKQLMFCLPELANKRQINLSNIAPRAPPFTASL